MQALHGKRRARLERMHLQLSTNQAEMLHSHFPHLIRYQSLTYQHVSSMLLREQRQKVQQILDILPLQAERGGAGMTESAVAVRICGLRAPDHTTNFMDGKQCEVRPEHGGGRDWAGCLH
jgi:hypothetical protein